MNQISFVADLPFELSIEDYGKIMDDIRRVVADNLLQIRGSGVSYEQAGLSEDCFRMLRDSLKDYYTTDELAAL